MSRPPNFWSLSLRQFRKVSRYIMDHPDFAGTHTMTDVVNQWVKDWTAGTGCGVAMLLNGADPRPAEVMISHAWREMFGEFAQSIEDGSERSGVQPDTTIWICSFANFQNEDGSGPDVKTQLDADPFGTVIRSTEVGESVCESF